MTHSKNIIVFDLETKTLIPKFKDKKKKRKEIAKMEISVLCCYDYNNKKYSFFNEKNIKEFISLTNKCEKIIGYNILDFDYLVLKKYGLKIKNISKKTFDIFDFIKKETGEWISLDSLSMENLGRGKLFKGKEMVDLKKADLYKGCKADVQNTKELYDMFCTKKLKYKHLTSAWKQNHLPTDDDLLMGFSRGELRDMYPKGKEGDCIYNHIFGYENDGYDYENMGYDTIGEGEYHDPLKKCPKCGGDNLEKFDEDTEDMTDGQMAEYMNGSWGTFECLDCKEHIDWEA